MNQLTTFHRILIDRLAFMLGVLGLCKSHRNHRPLVKKSQLSAFSIFPLDKPILEISCFGQIAFQPVSELFVNTEGKLSEVMRYFCSNTVVFVKSCNNRIVFL